MGMKYTKTNQLVGYADSANVAGRFGRSAFTILVDFAKLGVPAATGLVVTDIIDAIGALPDNCVVRSVAAQVVKAITVLSTAGISAIPLTLKAGSTTLASLSLAALNGPALGPQWADVSLSDGSTGVAGTKTDLSLTVGAVLDNAQTPVATAITGGILMLTFFVDYMPEPDELTALFQSIDLEVSDGGNTAEEVDFDTPYT